MAPTVTPCSHIALSGTAQVCTIVGDGMSTVTYTTIGGKTVTVDPAASRHKKRGYAAPPGSGPSGETCRSCKHIVRKQMSKTYLKCALMERVWTGGAGTDILAHSPACSRWERPA